MNVSPEIWIGVLSLATTMLLVLVGLLNFSIFRKQLNVSREQIDTSVQQLELAQRQPDLHLIQRAIAETSEHVRVFVERPYLRPYFYDRVEWREGDRASLDEVKATGELMLNNFASALMHSAAFPEYPVRGIDRTIMYHLRNSPVLHSILVDMFDRFPFTGLSLLTFMHPDRSDVEAELRGLIAVPGLDDAEVTRRTELLRIFQQSPNAGPLDFTMLTMQRRR